MALWTYADWITQTDQTTRLERLRLHISEVSQKTVGSKTRTGAYFPVDTAYLKMLTENERTLAKQVEPSTSPSIARSFAQCRRE
jgi:hypothetical protein